MRNIIALVIDLTKNKKKTVNLLMKRVSNNENRNIISIEARVLITHLRQT